MDALKNSLTYYQRNKETILKKKKEKYNDDIENKRKKQRIYNRTHYKKITKDKDRRSKKELLEEIKKLKLLTESVIV